MKFIIEHLDPEMWNWSKTEYGHIASFAGKENCIFTNVHVGEDKIAAYGEVTSESIKQLVKEDSRFSDMKKICILDPKAEKVLCPKDNFDYLILGGVLGNHPMDGRTEEALSSQIPCERRHLGDVQMSTNTAAYVTWKIINGTPFEQITFQDDLIIEMGDGEEIILPYRFVVEDGELVLPENYIEMVKKESEEF